MCPLGPKNTETKMFKAVQGHKNNSVHNNEHSPSGSTPKGATTFKPAQSIFELKGSEPPQGNGESGAHKMTNQGLAPNIIINRLGGRIPIQGFLVGRE